MEYTKMDSRTKKQVEDLSAMRQASRKGDISCGLCTDKATYADHGKLYCSKHFWQKYPELNKMR